MKKGYRDVPAEDNVESPREHRKLRNNYYNNARVDTRADDQRDFGNSNQS